MWWWFVCLFVFMSDNRLESEGARELVPALCEMKQLTSLNLECQWTVLKRIYVTFNECYLMWSSDCDDLCVCLCLCQGIDLEVKEHVRLCLLCASWSSSHHSTLHVSGWCCVEIATDLCYIQWANEQWDSTWNSDYDDLCVCCFYARQWPWKRRSTWACACFVRDEAADITQPWMWVNGVKFS